MDTEREREWERVLTAEQKRLEAELSSFANRDPKMTGDWDSRFPVGTELSASHTAEDERADFREEFESAIAQEHALESRLREVNAALDRIREHLFGVCRACSRPIPEERLRANPAAEYDIEHQPRDS